MDFNCNPLYLCTSCCKTYSLSMIYGKLSFSDSIGCACQLEETQVNDSRHYHGAQNEGKGIATVYPLIFAII